MKELKVYQCEVCGATFDDEKKAKECEQSHMKIIKTISAKFKPYTSMKDGTPDSVIIEFEDGSKVSYIRE